MLGGYLKLYLVLVMQGFFTCCFLKIYLLNQKKLRNMT